MWRFKELFGGCRTCSSDLRPHGIPKVHFLKSQWEELTNPPSVSWSYLTWRGLYLLFCVCALIISVSFYGQPQLWPIYLTNWSLSCQLIYSILFFVNLISFKISSSKEKSGILETHSIRRQAPGTSTYTTFEFGSNSYQYDGQGAHLAHPGASVHEPVRSSPAPLPNQADLEARNNQLESMIWVLSGIVGTLPIFVTVGYWAVIYRTEAAKSSVALTVTLLTHGINAIFSFLDTMINAIPVRVTHAVYLISFGATYAAFSWLYDVVGGRYRSPDAPYIYPVLNWHENPRGAIIAVILGLPVMLLLFYAYWLLHFVRLRLTRSHSWRRFQESCP